jgi:dephospho-CoA kinase
MDLPLKVGLTGGIASGKTTVSNLFAKLGVPVIDADVIAHALVEPRQPALKLIKKAFGSKIINSDGCLNRAKLRQQIFADEQQRECLEAILHPRIHLKMQEQVAQLGVSYCLLCIPLLLETQQLDMVERVLVVDCPPDLQYKHLVARDGFLASEIKPIFKAQASREARLAIANDVIYNDSDLGHLVRQVLALHQYYEYFLRQ